jgi:hypothetical protein
MEEPMFCPGCGVSEDQLIQYCRTCGTDLRAVRDDLQRPGLDVASLSSAREEIARAVAAKIKEGQWWQVGAMVPEVEKLFESPEERQLRLHRSDEEQRLRRIRVGTITASVGLGLVVLFLLLSLAEQNAFLLIGPSLLVFLIGLGVVINGVWFTVPKQAMPDHLLEGHRQEASEGSLRSVTAEQGKLSASPHSAQPISITEETTRHLSGGLVETPHREHTR